MLMAYPDIFVFSSSANICDRSTVKLNENFVLLKYNIGEYLSSIKNDPIPQPIIQKEVAYTAPQKAQCRIPPPPGLGFPSNPRPCSFSDTAAFDAFECFTSTPYQQSSTTSSQEFHPKLYERRNAQVPETLTYGINSISHLASLFYEPPKPDTPPTNNNMPYWVDPVWRYQITPPVECVNIQLPELNTLNVFPIVVSPFNIQSTFQFDSQSGHPNSKIQNSFSAEDLSKN